MKGCSRLSNSLILLLIIGDFVSWGLVIARLSHFASVGLTPFEANIFTHLKFLFCGVIVVSWRKGEGGFSAFVILLD